VFRILWDHFGSCNTVPDAHFLFCVLCFVFCLQCLELSLSVLRFVFCVASSGVRALGVEFGVWSLGFGDGVWVWGLEPGVCRLEYRA